MRRVLQWLRSWIVLAGFLGIPAAHAAPIQITVDTASLAGTSAALAFDLIDGGLPANTLTLSGFASDGTLGAASATGEVTGTFPSIVTLGDTTFFNEYLQNLTLGSSFSFIFDTTGNAADATSFPDAFSLFLLDANTGLPLVTTNDPTGADALLLFNIGEADPFMVYTAAGVTVTAAPVSEVPAPSPFLLTLLALALLSFTSLVIAHHHPKNHYPISI